MSTTKTRDKRNGTLLGTGLYSLPEASRYLRVPSATLHRWAEGYEFKAKDGRTIFSKSVLLSGPLLQVDGDTVISFQDLVHLQFVSLFRKYGLSMAVIRAVAKRASDMFSTDHPFAVQRLQTDGVRIFAEMTPNQVLVTAQGDVSAERIVQDLRTGQTVIGSIARFYFRDLDYDHNDVARWWPLGRQGRVCLDPDRSFGKPIDALSGVPLYPLYRMVQGGESVEKVAHWYDIGVEAVEAALEFESQYLRKAA